MKYLLCFLMPPLAVLLTHRPFSAFLNLLLTLCLYFPGAIHAILVVNMDRDEERHAEMISAITGKRVRAKRSEETKIFFTMAALAALLVVGFLTLGGIGIIYEKLHPGERLIVVNPVTKKQLSTWQDKPVAAWKPGPKHEEFISTIQDVYDVASATFVRDDYLQVIFSAVADEDPQGTCQAIANLWAFKEPQPRVTVDAWEGEQRIASASVIDGRTITPPPPTGRRSVAGEERRKAERAEKNAQAAAALEGKTLAEVEGTHGPALAKNKDTGWAEFKTFRARFENGKVAEVSVK